MKRTTKIKRRKGDPIYPYPSGGEAAMVFLNGSKYAFRCHCSCNVFHHELGSSVYECNACGERYQGS